ncbi:MAG: glycosyl hydrolase family 28-related protein [Planctomycetota bacterium]
MAAVTLSALSWIPAANAERFHVVDFGAKGNGVTDDGPAIRNAIAAAVKAAPGAKVVFEPKRYRLKRTETAYHIDLQGVKGLTLEGNGAELINNPWNSLVRLDRCEDVTVRGFVLDCDPLPFTQGTITGVDTAAGSFTLQIHEGYDNPVAVYREIDKNNPRWGWGVCIDPEERGRKPTAAMHFHLQDVEEQPDGGLRVMLADRARRHASGLSQGDRFVFALKYGPTDANIKVIRSRHCRLENITFYTAKYGMTFGLFDNHGKITVRNAKITFKPGSKHLITTPKDGFHCKHNAVGPTIQGGMFEGLLDDTINISVCPYWVREDLGDNRYMIADLAFLPRVGDRLMAYRPKPGTVTHGLIVKAIEPHETPSSMSGRWAVVTLNKPIPDLGLHEGSNLFPGGPRKLQFTGLYNLDAAGNHFVVRGNTFGPQRRHAILARASGGLIENNTITGVGGNGVRLGNEIGSFYEGPLPRNTVIRNNTFTNTYFDAIHIYTNGIDATAQEMTIKSNRITGWHTNPIDPKSAAAISLRNVVGAVIEDNEIGPSAAPEAVSVPIRLDNCKDVRMTDPDR